MAFGRSIATVGGFTMVSRVFGFVRDILIAALVGAGPVADAFFVAFRIPNFFRRLFAEGAFNAAFVPVFSRILTERGRPAAEAFAAEVMTILLVTLVLVTLAAEAAMPAVVAAIAPGFLDEPEKFELTVTFTRLTFPYLLFMALTALFSGLLNSLYRFAAAAAAPILLNVALIAALVLFTDAMATPGHALAWGVATGGLAQVIMMVVAARRAGVRLQLPGPRPRLDADVRRMLRLMVPGAIGAGVMQINLFIGTIIASLLPTGSVSYLYYADRVYQLPLGVIGIAIGTALLPLLSRQLRGGEMGRALASQNRAIEYSLLLTLPAAAALMIIPGPIVTVLFQRGAFDPGAGAATAAALAAFAAGLPAYVLVRVLSPGFFAREDTATPVKIAAVSVAANVALSLALIGPLAHVGIAVATAASSWLNAALLGAILWRRAGLAPDARLGSRLWRAALATAVMGAGLAVGAAALAPWLDGPLGERVAALAILVVGGAGLFFAAALALGAGRLDELKRGLKAPAG